MASNRIEAVDIFCGIGGLSFGIKSAGISVVAGLDNDVTCKYSFEKNNNAEFIRADVTKYDFVELKNRFSDNSIKILVGCAPCQPFSSHSFKNKKEEGTDKRWNLIDKYADAVEKIQPDVISMENVRGITKTQVFKDFLKRIKSLGYAIDWKVVYCPDYGIPQNRSRLVLLGSRIGQIKVPEPTHSKNTYVTVDKIIKKMPAIDSGEEHSDDKMHKSMRMTEINKRRIKSSKQGGTWHDWEQKLLPECYKKKTGATYTSVYGRMSWNSIAPTITTQFFSYGTGRFGHPEQDRAISLREGALIQTFPKKYKFNTDLSMSILGRQIGNALPPKLGEVIGKAIVEHVRECG